MTYTPQQAEDDVRLALTSLIVIPPHGKMFEGQPPARDEVIAEVADKIRQVIADADLSPVEVAAVAFNTPFRYSASATGSLVEARAAMVAMHHYAEHILTEWMRVRHNPERVIDPSIPSFTDHDTGESP